MTHVLVSSQQRVERAHARLFDAVCRDYGFPAASTAGRREALACAIADFAGTTRDEVLRVASVYRAEGAALWADIAGDESALTPAKLDDFYAQTPPLPSLSLLGMASPGVGLALRMQAVDVAEGLGAKSFFDLGGGDGTVASLARAGGIAKVTCFEPNGIQRRFHESMAGRGLFPEVVWNPAVTGDEGTYDFGTCIEVLEHVWDVPAVVRRLFALLRPGGTVFVTSSFHLHPHPGHLRRNMRFAGQQDLLMQMAGFEKVAPAAATLPLFPQWGFFRKPGGPPDEPEKAPSTRRELIDVTLADARELEGEWQLDEALRLVERLVQFAPEAGDVQAAGALLAQLAGDGARATRFSDEAVLRSPTPATHTARAKVRWSVGDHEAAWSGFLAASEALSDDGVLIVDARVDDAEVLSYAGLLPGLAPHFSRVVLGCRPHLAPLYARQGWPLDVVPLEGDREECTDVRALPALAGLKSPSEVAGAARRLTPDAVRQERWRSRLTDDRPLVLLAWQGPATQEGARLGSLPLSALRTLVESIDARYVSVQHGFGIDQLDEAGEGIERWLEEVPETEWLEEFVALASLADLVVAPDGLVAHLAGALQVPTFVPLPARPSWRWGAPSTPAALSPTLTPFVRGADESWDAVAHRMVRSIVERG